MQNAFSFDDKRTCSPSLASLSTKLQVFGGITMKIDSESFKGKLWLLIIDKVFIGALIAAALFLYNGTPGRP